MRDTTMRFGLSLCVGRFDSKGCVLLLTQGVIISLFLSGNSCLFAKKLR